MVARSAGSFLGGFFNNPGLVAIALGIGALLVFRKPIQEAFASFGENFGKLPPITLPPINFPALPAFPEIKFPEFPAFPDFGDLFSGFQTQLDTITNQLSNLDQPGREMGTTTMTESGIDTTGGLADRQQAARDAIARAEAEKTLAEAGPIGGSEIVSAANELEFRNRQNPIQTIIESIMPVQSAISDQQFFGGGPSFIGGSVSDTPITGKSTLGFIIDKLGVTASQAADIRAQEQGFTSEEQSFLGIGTNEPVTSDPQFGGLSPEEIALRLTGGIISNF